MGFRDGQWVMCRRRGSTVFLVRISVGMKMKSMTYFFFHVFGRGNNQS